MATALSGGIELTKKTNSAAGKAAVLWGSVVHLYFMFISNYLSIIKYIFII